MIFTPKPNLHVQQRCSLLDIILILCVSDKVLCQTTAQFEHLHSLDVNHQAQARSVSKLSCISGVSSWPGSSRCENVCAYVRGWSCPCAHCLSRPCGSSRPCDRGYHPCDRGYRPCDRGYHLCEGYGDHGDDSPLHQSPSACQLKEMH